jgi:hypothetical protein
MERSNDGGVGLLERAVRRPIADYGTEISRTGDSLGQLGEQLRRVGAAPVGDAICTGATYARRYGEYLQNADLATLIGDVDRFARRQPAPVIAAAFFIGLAVARILKAGTSASEGTRLP